MSELKVGFFVTCLVDLFRPQVAFACIKLLENAACQVVVPLKQTCCGQPAYNNGDHRDTAQIATQVFELFKDFTYVVVPSGSCGGMIKKHYPKLFAEDAIMRAKADDLSARTFEIISFLHDILHLEKIEASFKQSVTYHDACSGLRELNIYAQPRNLLSKVQGLSLKELPDTQVCCGFGGTFCVKYPDISNKMVSDKAANIVETGANILLSGDLGCLMNIVGKLKRDGQSVNAFHIAEVLANMASIPIGEPA